MNYKITLLLLVFTTYCNSQNVSFSDLNFKNALLNTNCVDADMNGSYESDADLNNDGEIQLSEALAIQRLNVSNKNIANLTGLGSFVNLKKLLCYNNLLTSLDLSTNVNLEYIDSYSNSFVSLNISNLPLLNYVKVFPNANLQHLTINYNPSLETIILGNYISVLPSLVTLNCSHNALTGITFYDLDEYPNLINFDCSYNQLAYVSVPDAVTILNISNNLLTGYNISNPIITSLDVSNNNLTFLNVYNCPNLNVLQFYGNDTLNSLEFRNTNMSSITIEDLPNLSTIGVVYNEYDPGLKLTSLELNNLPALTSLYASENNILNLELENMPSLSELFLENNPNINLTLTNLPSLIEFTGEGGNTLQMSNMSNLTSMLFNFGADFNEIAITNTPLLETFTFYHWNINSFSLTNAPNLTTFNFKTIQETPFNLILNDLPSLATVSVELTSSCAFNFSDLPQLTDLSIIGVPTYTLQDLPQLNSLYSSGATIFNLSNLPELYTLTVVGGVTTLNLENFPSLYSINASSNPITSLSLVNLPSLHDLDLSYCYTGQSNNVYTFANLPALYSLNLKNTSVSNVTLTNLPSLYDFKLKDNVNMTSLNFNNLPSLFTVDISQCINLGTVLFDNLNDLNTLNIYSCGITSLNLHDLPNLTSAFINQNSEIVNNGLVFSNLPNLSSLEMTFNQLTTQTFSSLPALTELDISHNSLYTINLSNLSALSTLDISGNSFFLTALDLSSNPNISSVDYSNGYYNDQLKYINLRNGNNNLTSLKVGTSVTKICVDSPAEKTHLQSLDSSLANTVFTTYCSFNPAGTFYTLQGNVLLDADNNGCDVNDVPFPMIHLNITNNSTIDNFFANNSGAYQIPFTEGVYTLSPALENTYYTISPSSLEVAFPSIDTNPLVQNFCVVPNGTHNDLEILVLPISQARPGFNATYKIVYKNKGNQTQSGTINLTFDDSILDYISTSQAFVSQVTNLLTWDFSNLKPFETKAITVVFNLNTAQEIPAVVSGNILNYSATIVGLTDETPSDNTGILNQSVVNSFDPNDKTCLQGTEIEESNVGDYVHYMIRFENTGTASAVNIVVKDMIDLNKFDLSTLIPLNSSHNFYTRITNLGQVEFIFENINLTNMLPNRKGYIAFKIKTKSTLVANDSFSNQVNIYFDYNNPIITNNYVTTILGDLETPDYQKNNKIIIYPNPVTNNLFFKTEEIVSKVEFFDLNGRILMTKAVNNQMIDISELPSGIYLVKVFTEKEIVTFKIIKN